MIAEIRRVAALLEAPPYRAAFFLAHGAYKFSHLYRHFGGWAGALEAAGLAHLAAPPRRWTWREKRGGRWTVDDQALLDDLKRVAALTGGPGGNDRTIREGDIRRHGRHAAPLYAKRFGSWHAAAKLAGLAPVWTCRSPTDAECIDNLRQVWTRLGRPPRAHEMDRPPSTVRAQVYQRRWGGWIKALRHVAELANANDNDPLRLSLDARALPPAPPVPREERHAVPVALRHAILTRDRFRCVLCGASPATDPRVTLQLDHIQPFSQGGRTVPENLRTLCADCNVGRGPHAHARMRQADSGRCGGLPAMVDQEQRQGPVGPGKSAPSGGRRRRECDG
ncbi:MAG: HNH endonuclease [Rhodospirillales bacterium]|nr:HNH endonuclease [Rhodospirillales bacterium]